ncbi:hypothetical protein WJX82_002522 [Trebouxia sp. C0006]
MGGANTKHAEDEPPPVSGIRVTEGLIRQLHGESAPTSQGPSRAGGHPWLPHMRPAFSSPAADDSGTPVSQQDEQTSSSDSEQQQHSAESRTPDMAAQHGQEQIQQSAGHAELKAEAASQQKVNQYANQLVKEYEAPLKALPCQDEKTSCLDPLQCADQVAAFTKCARKASAVMVQ